MNIDRQIFYQIVFGTKHREGTLEESHQEDLYKYIWGVIKEKGVNVTELTEWKITSISFPTCIRRFPFPIR